MLPFRALDADLAQREVRVLHVEAGGGLPAGAYLFDEAYCTEPGCDCRRVLLQVLHAETRTHVATINYAFEPPKPPHDVEGQVFLDPLNPPKLSDTGAAEEATQEARVGLTTAKHWGSISSWRSPRA